MKISNRMPSSMVPIQGGLMALVWDPQPESVKEAELNGSTYSQIFSDGTGGKWTVSRRINSDEAVIMS